MILVILKKGICRQNGNKEHETNVGDVEHEIAVRGVSELGLFHVICQLLSLSFSFGVNKKSLPLSQTHLTMYVVAVVRNGQGERSCVCSWAQHAILTGGSGRLKLGRITHKLFLLYVHFPNSPPQEVLTQFMWTEVDLKTSIYNSYSTSLSNNFRFPLQNLS